MSEKLEWRNIYGRPTLFLDGIGVGDAYPSKGAEGDVWRLRIWPPDRLQGGRERYVLASAGVDTARQVLLEMLERARGRAA